MHLRKHNQVLRPNPLVRLHLKSNIIQTMQLWDKIRLTQEFVGVFLYPRNASKLLYGYIFKIFFYHQQSIIHMGIQRTPHQILHYYWFFWCWLYFFWLSAITLSTASTTIKISLKVIQFFRTHLIKVVKLLGYRALLPSNWFFLLTKALSRKLLFLSLLVSCPGMPEILKNWFYNGSVISTKVEST